MFERTHRRTNTRTQIVNVRLRPDELAAIREAATAAGLTVGDLMREALAARLGAARGPVATQPTSGD